MNRFVKSGLCAAFLICGAVTSSVHAAAVVSNPTPSLDVNTVPPPGSDGYVFYQVENAATPPNGGGGNAGTNLGTVPSYVSVNTAGDSFFASGSGFPYTTLNIGGTNYKTGIAYKAPGNGVESTLATITLNAGVPTTFRLGVLTNNTDNTANIASAVRVAGSNSVSQTTTLRSGHNDFYYFDITGQAGDVITVNLTQSGGAAAPLGGLTFDTVPEPTSLGLLGLGGLMMLRRRRAQ